MKKVIGLNLTEYRANSEICFPGEFEILHVWQLTKKWNLERDGWIIIIVVIIIIIFNLSDLWQG